MSNSVVLENSSKPKFFLCEYRYEGDTWVIKIPAASFEDAEARLKQISKGKVAGEFQMSIPARVGLTARFLTWIFNRAKSLRHL